MTYDGIERREHCQQHELNSQDLAALKSSFSYSRWIVGGVGTLLLFVCTLGANAISSHLTRLNTSISELKGMYQAKAESDAGLKVRIEYLERAINEMQGERHK